MKIFASPRTKHLYVFSASNNHGVTRQNGEFISIPKVLELHDLKNVQICNLNHSMGLERVEVFGDAPNFVEFQFVPPSVVSMWEDRQPGQWQGEFFEQQKEKGLPFQSQKKEGQQESVDAAR